MSQRIEAVTVRFTVEEKRVLLEAASKSGLNPAAFIRYTILKNIKEDQKDG